MADKMTKGIAKKSKDYRAIVTKRLSTITPLLQEAALGDYPKRIKVPPKKDDFTEFLVALNLTIESFQKVKEEKKRFEEEAEKHSLEMNNIKKALLNITDDLSKEKIRLEKEKTKGETILKSIEDGVVVTDEYGTIIIMNKSAQKMLNIKSAVGIKFFNVWSVEDENGHAVPLQRRPIQLALSTTTTTTTGSQYHYLRKDGTKFPVAISVSPVILQGKIVGAVHIFRDIAKEKKIERIRTEFVSLASHQLRTPLGIVKWYLETIKEESYFKNAPETILSYLNEIYKNNERLICLVHDLLSVSRIDQGRIKDNPQKTDIAQLIKDIVKEMKLAATTKNITLDLVIRSDSLPAVFIDPLRLREVIENLITNAIEYNIPSGSVEVMVDRKTDDMLLISIKDTGIGLSEEDQKKLFTKFFRSEKAVSKNPDGSGLGLYVVKSYIETWGGKLLVESQEGKGSVFTLTIPLKLERNRSACSRLRR